MSRRIQSSQVNHFEGGWESRLRHNDRVSPNRGPESYRFTPERPKLLRSPPPPGSSPSAEGRSQESSRASPPDDSQRLERLQAEVERLKAQAQQLTEEGEDMRIAIGDNQDTLSQLQHTAAQHEDAIELATLQQQEAEDALSVLEPKLDLIRKEHNRVVTTTADLWSKAKQLEVAALAADDTEEELGALIQNVVHRSTLDMIDHEKALDSVASKLKPDLDTARRARVTANQELARLRTNVTKWTRASTDTFQGEFTGDQQELSRLVHDSLHADEVPPELSEDEVQRQQKEEEFNDKLTDQFMRSFGNN